MDRWLMGEQAEAESWKQSELPSRPRRDQICQRPLESIVNSSSLDEFHSLLTDFRELS